MNLQRDLYLASRTVGDINAAKRGTLLRRVALRSYHRTLIRGLCRAKIWSPR